MSEFIIPKGRYKIIIDEDDDVCIVNLEDNKAFAIHPNHPKYHIVERGLNAKKILSINDRWRLSIDKEGIYSESAIYVYGSSEEDGDSSDNRIPNLTQLKDVVVRPEFYKSTRTNTILDDLISVKGGFTKAASVMVDGQPGVGKTTILMEAACDAKKANPDLKVLFVSAEMTKLGLKKYTERFPRWENIPVLFFEENEGFNPYSLLKSTLKQGWDIVIIDSLNELVKIVTTTNIKEDKITHLFKNNQEGKNDEGKYTTFLNILQINKDGSHKGGTRIIHLAESHLRIKKEANELGGEDCYMYFVKNREGLVNNRLYYNFYNNKVEYDEERYLSEKFGRFETPSSREEEELEVVSTPPLNVDEYEGNESGDEVIDEYVPIPNSSDDETYIDDVHMELDGDLEFGDTEPMLP